VRDRHYPQPDEDGLYDSKHLIFNEIFKVDRSKQQQNQVQDGGAGDGMVVLYYLLESRLTMKLGRPDAVLRCGQAALLLHLDAGQVRYHCHGVPHRYER
jgi:hypothetical protein